MRGSIDADRSRRACPARSTTRARLSRACCRRRPTATLPVFLPAGTYVVSNLTLPRYVRLSGVPGATRIVYGGDGHLLIGRGRRAYRTDRPGHRRRQPLDRRSTRRASSIFSRVAPRRRSTIARSSAAARTASRFERVGGRIERSTISGRRRRRHLFGRGGRARRSPATPSPTAPMAASSCIAGSRPTTAPSSSGNRVERIAARNGGTGQNGNGINVFRADNVMVVEQRRQRLRLLGDPRQQRQQPADRSQHLLAHRRDRASMPNSPSKAPSSTPTSSTARPTASRSSISTRAAAWPSARQHRAQSVDQGPLPADAPGFGVGITVEADTAVTGNVVENAPLYGLQIGWGPYMRNVVATGNVIRKAGTGIAVTWSKAPARR